MTLTRGAIIALLAALAIVAGGATISPAFAQPAPTESDIQFELDSAKAARDSAADRLDKARQERELAEQARKNARDAGNAADRNGWNRRAREHDRLAADLEEEAAGRIAAAERKEAKAGRLQERLNAATQADDRRRALQDLQERELKEKEPAPNGGKGGTRIALSDVLGEWRIDGDDSPFRIVQEDPEADPSRLEAHTADRVWKGAYEPLEEGQPSRRHNARLTFTYQPKAAEMNPEIPLWARKVIEGRLEWKIELDEDGEVGQQSLKGKWYPGEVRWKEALEGQEGGANDAWVSGPGEARAVRLEKEPEVELSVEIIAAEPPHGPLDEIGFGELFRVRLEYAEPPTAAPGPVSVRSLLLEDEIEVIAEPTDLATVYMTPPIRVSPQEPLVQP